MNDIVECIIQGRFGDINMKNVARVQEGIQNEAKYQRILTSGFRHRRVKRTP